MKSASIVINTLNRANLLLNTLKSFLHLDFDNFEVIVVNDGSRDRTMQELEKHFHLARALPEQLQIGAGICYPLRHAEIQIAECQCRPGRDPEFGEVQTRPHMGQLKLG